MTISKREVLLAICETPGWSPTEDASTTYNYLQQLQGEGWVINRLNGWEATPKAFDAYPGFADQADIADPTTPTEHVEHKCVPYNRVMTLVAALLTEMPYAKVKMMTTLAPAQVSPHDKMTWELAKLIAESMRR